jgi:glyoxylase I family protein
MAVKSIFHININCTEFDRSLAFYQLLGFQLVRDLGVATDGLYRVGLDMPPQAVNRAAFISLEPDHPRSTRIDLIEWVDPATHGRPSHLRPHSDLAHVGVARIALWTIDIDAEYQRLQGAGVKFFSGPVTMDDGTTRFCCFTDPDGTILELIEFDRSQDADSSVGSPG